MRNRPMSSRNWAKVIIALCAVVILFGCDSATEPEVTPQTDLAAYVISVPSTYEEATSIQMGLGQGQPKHDEWGLGLMPLNVHWTSGITSQNVVISGDQTATFAVGLNGAPGVRSMNGVPPRFAVYSDWAPSQPNSHPMMKFGNAEFSFLISKARVVNGNWMELPTEIVRKPAKTTTSGALWTELLFPADDIIRYVLVRQLVQVGCTGSDKVVFWPNNGLVMQVKDADSDYTWTVPIKPSTITCTRYENVEAAKLAATLLNIATTVTSR